MNERRRLRDGEGQLRVNRAYREVVELGPMDFLTNELSGP